MMYQIEIRRTVKISREIGRIDLVRDRISAGAVLVGPVMEIPLWLSTFNTRTTTATENSGVWLMLALYSGRGSAR